MSPSQQPDERNPYAPPPRDAEAAGDAPVRAPVRAPEPQSPWGPPTGVRSGDAPPPTGAGALGTWALVLGLLAVVAGITVVGGVLLGTIALALGAQGRLRARVRGGSAGTAIAGMLLGVLGLGIAAATYAWVHDDIEEYQGCRKESVSLVQDKACDDALRRSITGS